MPRIYLKYPLYSDFFDPPLTEDVEELLGRFQQMDSVRFDVFSSIWREMRFTDAFLGSSSITEMKRFSRVSLATAVKYFLPPYSYQIRVGGLYLMHALYHTQLPTPPVPIRLALKDWTHVQKFRQDSVNAGHHDVVYILMRLEATKAIHYTAMPHFLTFQKMRNPKKQSLCAEFLGRTTAVHDLLSLGRLEEMTNVEKLYEKLKEGTVGVGDQVALTQRDLTSRLKDTMSEFLVWQQKTFPPVGSKNHSQEEEEEEGEEEEEEEACSSRASLISAIKQKSYSNFQEVSKARRHRQVNKVDPAMSGPEQVQVAVGQRKKKQPSLRARTWKSLGNEKVDGPLFPWALTSTLQNLKKEPET